MLSVCNRSCFVAVIGGCSDGAGLVFGSDDFKIGGFDGKISINIDCPYCCRLSPTRARGGIAYVSNVAVREKYCRKGIAKKLVTKAEAQAKSWGCRAIALHCDLDNPGAIKLYKNQGFRCVKIPAGAKWPTPRTSPDIQFAFMMKLLPSTAALV